MISGEDYGHPHHSNSSALQVTLPRNKGWKIDNHLGTVWEHHLGHVREVNFAGCEGGNGKRVQVAIYVRLVIRL